MEMIGFFVLVAGVGFLLWLARGLDPRATQKTFDAREAIRFGEDASRMIRHHCPRCDEKHPFLECRLTGRDRASVWIPNLRFCINCGTVLHIEEVRVEF